mgnify:CR=1 FL=1
MLLLPEHNSDLKKRDNGWLNEQFKIGLHYRPKFESSQNADFNKTTDDYKSFVTQNAQIWLLYDFSKFFTFKFTLQDTRLWGGSLAPKTGSDGRLGFSPSTGQDVSTSSKETIPIKNDTDVREAFLVFKNFQDNS